MTVSRRAILLACVVAAQVKAAVTRKRAYLQVEIPTEEADLSKRRRPVPCEPGVYGPGVTCVEPPHRIRYENAISIVVADEEFVFSHEELQRCLRELKDQLIADEAEITAVPAVPPEGPKP